MNNHLIAEPSASDSQEKLIISGESRDTILLALDTIGAALDGPWPQPQRELYEEAVKLIKGKPKSRRRNAT